MTTTAHNGSHVLITGASSGLGAALARLYAGPGMHLSLGGRDVTRLEAVAAACRDSGATVSTFACDVTNAERMGDILRQIDDRAPIDILFANAGLGGVDAMAPAGGESHEIAAALFATNAGGVVNTIAPLLPRLVARGKGQIVVISSLAARIGLPFSPAYSGSKAAATRYAEGLRALLRTSGIQVTVIEPGFIDTPMARSLPGGVVLLWPAERAARAIRSAVTRQKRYYAFPWPLRLATGLAAALPAWIADPLLGAAYRRMGPSC